MSKYIILDCKKCGHYTSCKTPCIYVDTLVNGNDRPRERPIPDDIIDRTGQRDYNAALAELIEDHEARDIERLEAIRTISDMRSRLIAASILVGIPQGQIAKLANISQGRISQLYRAIK